MHTQVDACVCNTAAVEYPLGHVALDTAGFGVDGDAHGMCPSSFWVQVVARLGHVSGEQATLDRREGVTGPGGGGPAGGGGWGRGWGGMVRRAGGGFSSSRRRVRVTNNLHSERGRTPIKD